MKVGIPKEVKPGERRAAATPDTTKRMITFGFDVLVESGAGALANFPDAAYLEAGATIVDKAEALWAEADVVLKVNAPEDAEVALTREGQTLISFLWPGQNEALVETLRGRGVTSIAMDKVPRITRAQKMDALSSMANIAGYRAVVEAAAHYGSFFTGQFTAAGKVAPARVLVIGAGVAGLAAMGAARGLGAIVRAFDTREAVKEQVESMGGEFLVLEFEESGDGGGGYAKLMSKEFIDAEMALFREQASDIDIVITTALIPGRPAPKLWLEEHVKLMKPGSVVVDLAAAQGGNCECTVPGEVAVAHDVTLIGYTDLTSRLPSTASQLYGMNLVHFLDDLGKNDGWNVNLDDEIIRGAIVTHESKVLWPPPKVEAKPAAKKPAAVVPAKKEAVLEAKPDAKPQASAPAKSAGPSRFSIGVGLFILAWVLLRWQLTGKVNHGAEEFLNHLTVFVLACFVGWQVVWSVTAALHTPLMSVTNAISGIIIVGGMLQLHGGLDDAHVILSAFAILLATINIAGGFLVTQRMLAMFRR